MQTDQAHDFYADVLRVLREHDLPHLVTGTYALQFHTGISRPTKDLDLFVHYAQVGKVLDTLSSAGFRTELTFPHWLGKVFSGDDFIDIIFSSGNGLSDVDDAFFVHAQEGELFGVPVCFSPVEEMIWSKAFVMERERYDGADVAHLLHECAGSIDWVRLIARFETHHRVLLSHLVLFGFIYPNAKSLVPRWVIPYLVSLLDEERDEIVTGGAKPICGGTLLSREQFLIDIKEWGLADARLAVGSMSAAQIAHWTQAIGEKAMIDAERVRAFDAADAPN